MNRQHLDVTTVTASPSVRGTVESLLKPKPARLRWTVPYEKPWSRRLRRALDILLGGSLLILMLPILIAVSLLIRLDSPGLPFYRQRRVGLNGKLFFIFKLRTMRKDSHGLRENLYKNNEVDGILFKIKNDPRITSIGKVLRKYSVDEIPQLFNVLRGDMSLIGPRPFSMEVYQRPVDAYPLYEEWTAIRHKVRPGMTGLWQVSGRNRLPFSQLMELDILYVTNRTIKMDFVIFLKTFAEVIRPKGAS